MAGPAAGRLPTFLVAGFPKCGTTSLAAWLSAHPEIHVPPRKEIDYFDLHFSRGIEWYRSQFSGATSEACWR